MSDTQTAEFDVAPIWEAVVDLAQRDGVEPSKLPGCWNRSLNDAWRFKLNASAETRVEDGSTVPPFTLYVEFNGFPAGMLDPFGGVIAAGDAANAGTFLEALREAVRV